MNLLRFGQLKISTLLPLLIFLLNRYINIKYFKKIYSTKICFSIKRCYARDHLSASDLISYTGIRFSKNLLGLCTPKNWCSDYIIIALYNWCSDYIHAIKCHKFMLCLAYISGYFMYIIDLFYFLLLIYIEINSNNPPPIHW